jgi:hypothetical protein
MASLEPLHVFDARLKLININVLEALKLSTQSLLNMLSTRSPTSLI